MPFTFAHPALVLPFLSANRKWLSATGLLAGSLVPDFEYFLRMRKGPSYYSHTWPGLFWFDLPFAVLLTLVFHVVMRKPLLQRLPAPLQAWFAQRTWPDWPRVLRDTWPVVLLSIVLGILTHFGWDWFVHRSSDYLFAHQSALVPPHLWVRHSQLYGAVHLGHTLVGLAAIAWVIMRLPASVPPVQKWDFNSPFWLSIGLITAVIAALRIHFGTDMYSEDLIVAIISAFLLTLTAACVGDNLTSTSEKRP